MSVSCIRVSISKDTANGWWPSQADWLFSPQALWIRVNSHSLPIISNPIFSHYTTTMITLISATNRPGSFTEKVAAVYRQRLEAKGVDYRYLSLMDMPQDLINNKMYDLPRNAAMQELEAQYLIPATKFIFIMPEYNGSFPGVLKAFIDASDIRQCFHNKKAALVGVSDGRAGNLRGMEHFTNILNHIKINVLHLKIPISGIGSHFDDAGRFTASEAVELMDQQIDLLLDF